MLLTDDLLLNYKRCQRRAFLQIYGDRREQDPIKDFLLKLRKENQLQIDQYLGKRPYIEPQANDWESRALETEELMAKGTECIYQGVLVYHFNPWQNSDIPSLTLTGQPTVLLRQAGPSQWGHWHYRPINVKLGKRPKPEYKLVAALHSYLLTKIQGRSPRLTQLVLRARSLYNVDLESWEPRLEETISECIPLLSQPKEPEIFISRQRCSLCNWYNHCYAIAQKEQHLSLVPGVTPTRYESLQEIGVNNLESLADFCPQTLGQHLGADVGIQLQQQARAIVQNKVFWKTNRPRKPQLIPNADIEIYFDIEAEPDRNLDYLFGALLVNHTDGTAEFYPFLAETVTQEGEVWQKFVTFLETYPDAPIFHFAPYERDTIQRLAALYRTAPDHIQPILARLIDLHQWVVKNVVFPVESYSLKSLAKCLGFAWQTEGVSGDQTVCWYDEWLENGDRSLLDAIVRYNEDDCRATYRLKAWLADFINSPEEQVLLP